MDRFEQIRKIVLPLLLPYGVRRVAVFGSFARGDAGPESDIDILVEFEHPRRKPLGLLEWVRLEREMTMQLDREVDLVSYHGVSRHLRPYIERDWVMLYEAA